MVRSRSVVALVDAPVRYDAVLKALELVEDSVRDKLSQSSRIVIKPDFFLPKISTSMDSVRAVLDFILEFTNKKITIAEGLYSGRPIQAAFHKAGFHELADDYGLGFVDLNRDEYVTLQLGRDELSIAKGSRLSVRVAKTIINSDCRVSLAVPRLSGRSFFASTANLALGSVVGSSDKARLVASKNRDRELAEILEVVRPSLAVVDGFRSGFCVASSDAVAADVVAAAAMDKRLKQGIKKQRYLGVCGRAGLGQSSISRIKVVD